MEDPGSQGDGFPGSGKCSIMVAHLRIDRAELEVVFAQGCVSLQAVFVLD